MPSRPTPLDLVFDRLAADRFPPIRDALALHGVDPRDRDAFLMERSVIELLRELRPDEGVGEGIDALVALAHHAFLVWQAGALTLALSSETTERLVVTPSDRAHLFDAPAAFYVQLPERRFWGQPIRGGAHEPLDGCALHLDASGRLRVLAIFGVHPDRMALSVVEAIGERLPEPGWADGAPLFAPAIPGGAAAGLHSITSEDELLELGWRALALAHELAAPAERS